MHRNITTPISTLFTDNSDDKIKQVIDLSNALELRELSKKTDYGLPLIYHCESSLIHPWSDKELEQIKSIIANNPDTSFISLHLLNNYQDFKTNTEGKFLPGNIKMSEEEMLQNASENLAWLKKNLPGHISYGVENNNYFPTGAYETVTDPKFINNLIAKLDIKLLLDVGHAEITAHYRGEDIMNYIKQLNLEKVFQIHLSSPTITAADCQDSHNALTEDNWELLKKVLPLCPNLEHLTIEYYQDMEKLVGMLKKLREITKEYTREVSHEYKQR